MITHLSVRLCWHDSGWNGCVCKDPRKNTHCTSLDYIRESKKEQFGMENKGKHLSEFDCRNVSIPCRGEVGTYSSKGYEIKSVHPLKRRRIPGYIDLGDCITLLEPYSFRPAPYRWLMVENYNNIRKRELLKLRDLDNNDLYYPWKKKKEWIDDVELQERLLEGFWNKLEDGKSLVAFYVNSAPIAEEARRIVVGLGRIKTKAKMDEFGATPEKPGPNYVWQRRITQNFPAEGFRLPYQEYIEQGLDPQDILVTAPEDFENEFKYVSEHVSDGGMLAVAEKLNKTIERIQSDVAEARIKLDEDWTKHGKWIQRIIAELWQNRGQYPGIGSVLNFLGFGQGMTYHQEVLVPLGKKNQDVLEHTTQILDGKKQPENPYTSNFANAERKWKAYSSDPDIRKLLELLMKLEISEDQVERLIKDDLRYESGIKASTTQIVENPYLIAELDEGRTNKKGEVISEPITLGVVDQAMVPSFYSPDKYQTDDDRRVRSIMIDVLKKVTQEGDTLLSSEELIQRVRERFPGDRECNPDLFLIKSNKAFYEETLEFIGDKDEFIALKEVRAQEKLIALTVRELMEDAYDSEQPDWSEIMDRHFSDSGLKLDEGIEDRARKEKATALEKLHNNRFSVLTGRAGTGKTEVVKILVKGLMESGKQIANDFLILAPTGKARVRIQNDWKIPDIKPQTIHQHLNRHGWLDRNLNFTNDGVRTSAKTIIIDEASMLAVDLFATLIKSIEFSNVERLILVGDPNQLPPIGPGRPFDDIIKWLQKEPLRSSHWANLQERVRQEKRDSICLRLADGFLRDFKSKDIEEIYALMGNNQLSAEHDLSYAAWDDHDQLLKHMDNMLQELGITNHESYCRSVGLADDDFRKCESWQILSPVKHKEVSGTIAINSYLQRKFHSDTLSKWRARDYYAKGRQYPSPFGKTKDVVHKDKVIQIQNKSTLYCTPETPDSYVANGEIGIVRYYSNSQLKVVFSDQRERLFYYSKGEGNSSVELNLELAYAITVHKSQGSDFEEVILVIPEKAANISMELMYTALTRSKKKTHLLIQGGIDTLEKYRQANSSETDRRNTYLFKVTVRDDVTKIPYAENRIHKTKNGFLVRSKSEIIVANALINAGIPLTDRNYEKKLPSRHDQNNYKLPDFTFNYKGKDFYWEHAGMLSVESYEKSWKRKIRWYKDNGYESQLVTSEDGTDGSIDSQEIYRIIEQKLGVRMPTDEFSLDNLSENENVEFKSSVMWDYKKSNKNKELEFVTAKTLSAFMNTKGGLLVVGIDDEKNVLGIDKDLQLLKKKDEDGFQLKITEIISKFIGKEFAQCASVDFQEIEGKSIALVNVKRADEPTFVEHKDDVIFFIRTNNSTQPLNTKESSSYIRKNWG